MDKNAQVIVTLDDDYGITVDRYVWAGRWWDHHPGYSSVATNDARATKEAAARYLEMADKVVDLRKT